MQPKASYFHPVHHLTQTVVHGVLVTVFKADDLTRTPAGVLICRPWTEEDTISRYAGDEDDEDILGLTVTREGILFHDSGYFIPTP